MTIMKLKSIKKSPGTLPSSSRTLVAGPDPSTSPRSLRVFQSQKGSALVIAAIFMLVATMLIVVGVRLLVVSNQQTKQQTLAVAEAENAARAGLVDAINWYRRQIAGGGYVSYYQSNNPMTVLNPGCAGCQYIDDAFAPTQNATTQDTLDDTIGVVQQYPINGAVQGLANTQNIWARYEVHRQPNPAVTPSTAPTSTPNPKYVHDITGERITSDFNGQGLVWSLYSTGYIYLNNDSTKPYNQYPNKVLATAQMSTEIRKLGLSLPANAAALCPDMCNIVINGNGVVNSLSGGTTYYAAASASNSNSAGCPAVSGSGKISPSAAAVDRTPVPQVNGISAQPISIFGMTSQEIKSLADFTGDSSNPLIIGGSDKLSYFNGSLTFDPASPVSYYQNQYLNNIGTGVIYVDNGSFTLKPVTGSQTGAFFNGVIFCNGYVTIGEGNQVTGCVMAVNGITVGTGAGGSTEKAYLNFSLGIITREQQDVAVYREDKAASHNFIAAPNQ